MMKAVEPEVIKNLKEIGYELMSFSNKFHDKYQDNEFLISNIWRALSFYSSDIIQKAEFLSEGQENEGN